MNWIVKIIWVIILFYIWVTTPFINIDMYNLSYIILDMYNLSYIIFCVGSGIIMCLPKTKN